MKNYKLSPSKGTGFWVKLAARMMFQRDDLRRENKRLRQALEYYADENNHTQLKGSRVFGDVFYDKGKLARKSLGIDSDD